MNKKTIRLITANPEKFAHKVVVSELEALLRVLSDAYYNRQALVSDEVFDTLKDILVERDPDNKFITEVGAPVTNSSDRVKLPFYMGSLNKFKADTGKKDLERWLKKNIGSKCISDKMDGESAMLHKHGNEIKLYTRGDGLNGRDITHLMPKIISSKILDNLPKNITVRGELIVQKNDFEIYKDTFKNARNMVVGVIGSKTLTSERKQILKLIHYVTYEIIDQKIEPCQQFDKLKELGFEVPKYKIFENISDISNDSLKTYLQKRREKSLYDIDGIVIADNKNYERSTDKNPKYAIAFKMQQTEDVVEAIVKEVIWKPSVYGRIKPRIRIEPISLQGVTVTYATAMNARYVVNNKLGPNAVIKITRSGEVIPYIVEVIKPAKKTQMPDVEYTWDENQVDIYLVTDASKSKKFAKIIKQKINAKFFKIIGVKYLSSGIIKKLYDAGFKSPLKIISADRAKITEIEGLGATMVKKIYDNIEKALANTTLPKLMVASNSFPSGMGERRIKAILAKYPDIILESSEKKIKKQVIELKSFNEITATQFITGLTEFRKFLEKYSKIINIKKLLKTSTKKTINQTSDKLNNQKIVFTGFRDTDLEAKVISSGGEISSGVSKNTTVVVAKDVTETSSKVTKAKSLNIPVMTKEQFIKTYLN